MRVKDIIKNYICLFHLGFLLAIWRAGVHFYYRWKYRWNHRVAILNALRIQNNYDKDELRKESVVVFVLYNEAMVSGGFMSIFSIAATSRNLLKNYAVALSTGPGNTAIYAANNFFPNNEKVWRWGQIRRLTHKFVRRLIVHVPECYVGDFLRGLSWRDKRFFRSIPDIRINILNQNILLMPSKDKFEGLYEISPVVTQTTAHSKYNSQEMCDLYGIPTMRIGAYWECFLRKYAWNEKCNVIAYSPDVHPMRDAILNLLRANVYGYEIVEIKDLTYTEYLDFIARVKVVITFGEGMDGYFAQPPRVGTLSFAVFNEDFFPVDVDWKSLMTIFSSYYEMEEKLLGRLIPLLESTDEYYKCVNNENELIKKCRITKEEYESNIRRFYQSDFDYLPTKAT